MSEAKYRALLVEIQETVDPLANYNLWCRVQQALSEPTLKAYDKDKCLACGGYHGCSQLPCPEYLPIGADKPIHAVRTDVGKEVVSRSPAQAEPVGSLHISHFRDNPAMENIDLQLSADLKPSSYKLYLHPPVAQVATCSNCESCQASLNTLDVLTKMNKVIQEAECISPVVKEIASSKVAWLRGDIVVGEYESTGQVQGELNE